jgi:Domain of unknown function (DUF4157)
MSSHARAGGMRSSKSDPARSRRIEEPRPAATAAEGLAALQQSAGNAAVSGLLSGGEGAPMPPDLRRDMEQRFGHDFSAVRLHDNPRAADLAESLSAKAFTVGPHIAFSRGRFAPDTRDGKRLLGHELAHVVQQSRGGPPPSLDPASALEQSAETAAESASSGDGPVGVAGASAPGVARDIFDVQERLDREMAAEKGAGVPLDTKHLPSFNNPQHDALVGKLPTFEQIMTQAAQRRRLEELLRSRDPPPRPVTPPPAPPPEPAQAPPPAPPQAQPPPAPAPAATSDQGDPQATTPTALGYQGASNLNKGQSNVSLGLNYSRLTGGLTTQGQLATGLHDFPNTGGIAAVVSPSVDPSGNLGVSAYANPYLAPDGKHYNLGAYIGGTSVGGQRPPALGGSSFGGIGILAGEALIGKSRDQPLLTLGANAGLTYLDTAQVTGAGSSADPKPSTYLRNSLTETATGSAQLNLGYYRASDAADADYSKTPRVTIFGEGTYSHTGGQAYSDSHTQPTPGETSSYAVGGGVVGNLRLDAGKYILSGGLAAGYRREDDQIGKTTYSSGRPYYGLIAGGSF